jgi:hypothetical protein
MSMNFSAVTRGKYRAKGTGNGGRATSLFSMRSEANSTGDRTGIDEFGRLQPRVVVFGQ